MAPHKCRPKAVAGSFLRGLAQSDRMSSSKQQRRSQQSGVYKRFGHEVSHNSCKWKWVCKKSYCALLAVCCSILAYRTVAFDLSRQDFPKHAALSSRTATISSVHGASDQGKQKRGQDSPWPLGPYTFCATRHATTCTKPQDNMPLFSFSYGSRIMRSQGPQTLATAQEHRGLYLTTSSTCAYGKTLSAA
eukprot:6457278-Amphidinium_carterae.1